MGVVDVLAELESPARVTAETMDRWTASFDSWDIVDRQLGKRSPGLREKVVAAAEERRLTIGVVSDTHVPRRARRLPPQLLKGLEQAKVDYILHAGDLVDMAVLDELSAIAPVSAVAGNMDGWETSFRLPRQRTATVGGVSIGLAHGDQGHGPDTPTRAFSLFAGTGVAAVVFGHSHIPWCEYREGILLFNPGSPTDPRRQPNPSYGLIHVEGGPAPSLTGQILSLNRE